MPLVVGVRFRPAGKVYYFDASGFEDLEVGEYVIVETVKGQEAGQVILGPREISPEEVVGQLKGVVRRAEAWELAQMQHYRTREHEALLRCREKVAEHGLPMKVVKAEYNFDGSHLTFYFTAERRVDFRELVRDLARTFKTRIELRQIGVRDEAKLMGGIGPCGRILCCAAHLTEFTPISIKMAKHQNLPLSPAEISGLCGRLLCCLAYEDEFYCQMQEKLPRVGEMVETPHGRGKVTGVNVIKGTISVELESEVTVEVPAAEVRPARVAARSRRSRQRRS